MRKYFVLSVLMTCVLTVNAQETEKSSPFSASMELTSKYLWRGQEYGEAPTIFPTLSYSTGGLSADATAGILAATANVLALFRMVKDLKPNDKVKCIAYSVCCAFLIGDHLAFAANFQPTLILPIMVGKLCGGCLAVYIATVFLKKKILKTE